MSLSKEALIITAYRAGLTSRAVADKYNCSERGVRLVLCRNDVPRRSSAQQVRPDRTSKEDRIIADYQRGLTARAVAHKHNCSESCVRLVLRRRNVTTRSRGPIARVIPPDRQQQIAAAYAAGHSVAAVSEEYGVSPYFVLQALRKTGVPIRPPGANDAPPSFHAKVMALRAAGRTFVEIGATLGFTKQRAHQIANWSSAKAESEKR